MGSSFRHTWAVKVLLWSGPLSESTDIAENLAAAALHQLLQFRFIVAVQRLLRSQEWRILSDESARDFHPAVQIERRDDGLDGVGQDGLAGSARRCALSPLPRRI
jgi:hypothetical protein